MLIHATCVVLDEKAVLLAGTSGSGKSDLALRLIDRGAQLVADDQTSLNLAKGELIASAPPMIAGLLEIRHVGLVKIPYCHQAPVALYVDLVGSDEPLDRLPELTHVFLLDQRVQCLRLPAFAASTPAKIRAALLYPLVTVHD